MKFLLVVIVLGVAIYALVRLVQRRRLSRSTGPGPEPGPREVRRPSSPDDDPDFLRDLERKRRRRQGDQDSRPDGG